MNHDVPQPITATDSPALGRTSTRPGARPAARAQASGCRAISERTKDASAAGSLVMAVSCVGWGCVPGSVELLAVRLARRTADEADAARSGRHRPGEGLGQGYAVEPGVEEGGVEGVAGAGGVDGRPRTTGD